MDSTCATAAASNAPHTVASTTNSSTATPTPPPSLLDHLSSSLLSSSFPGSHSYSIHVVRSQPRRSHALFPWASNVHICKVFQQEVLVVVSENRGVTVGGVGDEKEYLPVMGLEAFIYTILSTSTSLVYISKIDTSGLSPSGYTPSRIVVSSFVEYVLKYPFHRMSRSRLFTFAKSHGQYLFPASKENEKKKVLDDKGLVRWWKATLAKAVKEVERTEEGKKRGKIGMWYLVPGMNRLESLPYVPDSQEGDGGSSTWVYGHPYRTLSSPLHPPSRSTTTQGMTAAAAGAEVAFWDQIPCFPDDPKARFFHSLTSSTIAPSGNENDYDDVMTSLGSATFASVALAKNQAEAIERERERERERLREGVLGGMEEWWERMGWRQECCSGVLTGFFCLANGEDEAEVKPELEEGKALNDEVEAEVETRVDGVKVSKDGMITSTTMTTASNPTATTSATPSTIRRLKKEDMTLPHATFIKLWSQFHNVDYAETIGLAPESGKMVSSVKKWDEDVERLVGATVVGAGGGALTGTEGEEEESARKERERSKKRYEKYVKRIVELKNPEMAVGQKRELEQQVKVPVVVNMLAPRKKKKVVAESENGPIPLVG
ncbi:BQ2448_7537 [Microbotryum intermedium]|uniref:histone acetyltransferase n=1 Tax=Microbotryum intermedium TaxID=269621 RepID=A0A238FTF9_9BASI|nr:BQ2448_7537 [Microbotryum intermedium]